MASEWAGFKMERSEKKAYSALGVEGAKNA